jgi:hypothetical protein
MVLYEDLRVYTIWRTEMAHFRQQSLQYKKSAEEWEILGELAERLHHRDEAAEAYEACLAMRFSPKALKGILSMHERAGNARAMLASLIRLISWQYRWYSEVRNAYIPASATIINSPPHEYSFLQPSSFPSASSSRKKAPSKSGALSKPLASHNLYLT